MNPASSTSTPPTSPPTSFLSLPRELRDEIYTLALEPWAPKFCRITVPPYRSCTYPGFYACFNLLRPAASNLQIALEARDFFFRKYTFEVAPWEVTNFLEGSTDISLRPMRGFDFKPWVQNLAITVRYLEEIRPGKFLGRSYELLGQLALLSECPALRKVAVEIIVPGYKIHECHLHDTLETLVEVLEAFGEHMGEVWRVKIATYLIQCYFSETKEHRFRFHELDWEGNLNGLRELKITIVEKRHMHWNDESHVHYRDVV